MKKCIINIKDKDYEYVKEEAGFYQDWEVE